MLRHCALSVSQGGYNTVVELLAAGARSVIVPFAAPGETEQTRRADRLAAEGLAHVLAEAELTPERLAAAIDQALAARPPQGRAIDLGGAEEAARAVAAVVGGRSRDAVGP
jgi:predicted glycosyltransferase